MLSASLMIAAWEGPLNASIQPELSMSQRPTRQQQGQAPRSQASTSTRDPPSGPRDRSHKDRTNIRTKGRADFPTDKYCSGVPVVSPSGYNIEAGDSVQSKNDGDDDEDDGEDDDGEEDEDSEDQSSGEESG
jgi:hypothetical protein